MPASASATERKHLVVFPFNGSGHKSKFHPYHDAMRLWWLLEFAMRHPELVIHDAERTQIRRIFWQGVGPIGQMVYAALDKQGVRPDRGSMGMPTLRLRNDTISPFRGDFLSHPHATAAVLHAFHSICDAKPPDTWPSPSSQDEPRILLIDRSPPRSLQIQGDVLRALVKRLVVSSDVCLTARAWNLPLDVHLTPHGAQLNNRFLSTQQPQPCLIEVFPLGYWSNCHRLSFWPQRHVMVMGDAVWDAHDELPSKVAATIKSEYESTSKRSPKLSAQLINLKLRSRRVTITNVTLKAALALCRAARVPRRCAGCSESFAPGCGLRGQPRPVY